MENQHKAGIIRIEQAREKDAQLLAELGKKTFLESHGNSAGPEDIDSYTAPNYSKDSIQRKLADPRNIQHIVFYNDNPAGFSNIILNASLPGIEQQNVTELDKLYLLKSFHGLRLGHAFIHHNIEISRNNHQYGMWLYVWQENATAIAFYKKTGFEIIGSHDFEISETRSNPNHLMFMKY